MSQHLHITIVELLHRLHDKTRIFLFFVRYRGWLRHIHRSNVVEHRTGPGNWHNKAQCLPISSDSDFLFNRIEGHRPDNNEVSRALPFNMLRSLAIFARYHDTQPH